MPAPRTARTPRPVRTGSTLHSVPGPESVGSRNRVKGLEAAAVIQSARRQAEAQLFRRLSDQKVVSGRNAYDAIQNCLDEAVHEQEFFRQEVEKLTPQQLAWQTPNRKLLTLYHQVRAEVEQVAGTMIKLGLDERVAKVKEAQVQMVVKALDRAMQDAGITPEQRLAIGAALKEIEAATLEAE